MVTVGTIYNRLLSISYVYSVSTNKIIDFINAAQRYINEKVVGDNNTKILKLTLVSNSCTLPTDLLRLIDVIQDVDSDGIVDQFLVLNSHYTITETYTQATGRSLTLTIIDVNKQTLDTYIRYTKELTDFPSDGYSALYSYYPLELMVNVAKYLMIIDSGLGANEYTIIQNAVNSGLLQYRAMECNKSGFGNNLSAKDRFGSTIATYSDTLNGSSNDNFENRFDYED